MTGGWVGSPGGLGQVYIANWRNMGTVSKTSESEKGPEQG